MSRLKIKDDVELENIEKYGFTVVDDDYIWLEDTEDIMIDRDTRIICVYTNCYEDNSNLGALYDLIYIKKNIILKDMVLKNTMQK